MKKIRETLEKYPEISEFSRKCLESKRYNSNVVLMVVDAALTSSGLNYFGVVVPKVLAFSERYKVKKLDEFLKLKKNDLLNLWRNERCWNVAFGVAEKLLEFGRDVKALRKWAESTTLENWKSYMPVKGVGINTYQYLRMMGGVDTVMPDRIVKREVKIESKDDIDFIVKAEKLAKEEGMLAIELCFAAWIAQYDEEKAEKYLKLLENI
ncbi:hypothetical protein [Ferroglobus sp.]|uniref:hypothetical protein n=1 Tax=Ferroglobus sp. TaxID=2614230 RepID=UPI0025BE7437|nr:hypothetical protein [Ferroglobus sp.]